MASRKMRDYLHFTVHNKVDDKCSRAGLRPSQATKHVRVSRKENVHCSCFLATEFNADGSVSVKGCFGHVGHDIDPALLRRKEVTTKAQRLKDACYQELSAIKQIQALTQANALAIAELGTSEALEALKEIKAYEELASDIEMFPSSSQVPRPETAQPGAERKLSTVSHCQRAENAKEDDESFRKEMRTMKDLLPFTNDHVHK
ncbi:unnamed protein product [Nippostrongylus brasiliensis]|uniref:Uncharacterized protein n=1 Tax=Nippostrongylus brasiliensis TaxID=27835 RepID=A0A0N4YK54_NIPBR|nr:unnamed protein product [Nippostrongylus brasiliensis]